MCAHMGSLQRSANEIVVVLLSQARSQSKGSCCEPWRRGYTRPLVVETSLGEFSSGERSYEKSMLLGCTRMRLNEKFSRRTRASAYRRHNERALPEASMIVHWETSSSGCCRLFEASSVRVESSAGRIRLAPDAAKHTHTQASRIAIIANIFSPTSTTPLFARLHAHTHARAHKKTSRSFEQNQIKCARFFPPFPSRENETHAGRQQSSKPTRGAAFQLLGELVR